MPGATNIRNAKNITVVTAISHILDPKGRGKILSDFSLSPENDEEFFGYLKDHIEASLRSERDLIAGQFSAILPGKASGCCKTILGQGGDFVQHSKTLADLLYVAMGRSSNPKAGDLAICIYEAENYPKERFLALLKLDTSSIFQHDDDVLPDGRRRVRYQLSERAFTREKLQKAAFVQELEPRPEIDLLLLDRQAVTVAEYFAIDFLEVEERYDATQRTQILRNTLYKAYRSIPKEKREQRRIMEDFIDSAFSAATFDSQAAVKQVDLDDKNKAKLETIFKKDLPEPSFTLDTEKAASFTSKKTWYGDFNLKLIVPAAAEDAGRVKMEEKDADPEDATLGKHVVITIKTESWELKRR